MSATPWTFQRCLKDLDVEELVDHRLHRPLAYLLIKPLERWGKAVTPTHVTLASMVMGISGGVLCFLAASHGPKLCIAGGAFIALSVLLDCADGQLARLRGGGTRFGMALDGAADIVVGVAFWIGLSRYLASAIDGWWVWPLCLTILASIVVHVGLYDQFKRKYLLLTRGQPPLHEDSDGSSRIERLIEGAAESVYAGIFARLAEELVPTQEGDRDAARRQFYRPMRITTYLGLGTNLFIMYVLAMTLADQPQWLLLSSAVAMVGVLNLWTVVALVSWRRASQSA